MNKDAADLRCVYLYILTDINFLCFLVSFITLQKMYFP